MNWSYLKIGHLMGAVFGIWLFWVCAFGNLFGLACINAALTAFNIHMFCRVIEFEQNNRR